MIARYQYCHCTAYFLHCLQKVRSAVSEQIRPYYHNMDAHPGQLLVFGALMRLGKFERGSSFGAIFLVYRTENLSYTGLFR